VEDARQLMAGVVNDERILSHMIFIESFSKSHGLCGERLGIYFTSNYELFSKLHNAAIAFSAGPGKYKDYQFLALGTIGMKHKQGIDELHAFWQQERKGLYNYLMSKGKRTLFAPQQLHIFPDIERPLGLYLLLKTQPGVDAKSVFLETGVLGIDTPLSSGHYIRYAVGQVTVPTYSKYLEKL